MNIRFLTIAQQEVDGAYHWFEDRTKGAGDVFLDELDRIIELIRRFPFAGSEIEPDIRRSLLARFPYAVVYGIDGQTIVVIGVAHTHRKPLHWVERLTTI